MDVFSLRSQVVNDYASYVRSFVKIREENLKDYVNQKLDDQSLWPQPLIQLNPSFQPGGWIDALVDQEVIHEECRKIFRVKKDDDIIGKPMRLHKHQVDAIHAANSNGNYVLTTGTGSGKSLSYIIPIVDHVLKTGRGQGVKAIVVYPMNALCNSQYGELEKFLSLGYGEGKEPVRFERYTGQESDEKRDEIRQNPPDILLTNYVMLELLLTRPFERQLVAAANNLRFLVLDELHTYRGRQGADVAMLTRRVRESCQATNMLCVGTSATMASGGSYDEQRAEIASVATRLFGSEFLPANVIGETLTRATDEIDFLVEDNVDRLRADLNTTEIPTDHSEFVASAMASWLETNFGLEWDTESNRNKRATPQAITGEKGAVRDLEKLTGLSESACETAIRRWLLAGYDCDPHPESGLRPFAFRLHQFISRGDTVFASLESENDRTISLSGQQFAPGSNKSKLFMPLAFCRECGAEYYTVRRQIDQQTERVRFRSRTLSENIDDPDEGEAGFLYRDSEKPWPEDQQEILDRLPEDWLEVVRDNIRIRANMRNEVPTPVDLAESGEVEEGGLRFWYTRAPFRFCQNCGVSYRTRRRSSDFGHLATLASGGRSSATTILSLSSIRFLKAEDTLEDHAKKFLSFTDNRQDASLQAGHLNDFVEVSLLRAALYKAAVKAGDDGIDHDELAQKVFKSLGLGLDHFAREPGVQFAQKADTEKAFRNVIGYRVYRDLKRGWRVTSPNLEQCGLITVDYPSLNELCQSETHWFGTHAALVAASPATRETICRALLDHMRRELAIDVDYLTYEFFERLQQQSSQRLREPWAIDEQEKAEIATMIYPRSRKPHDSMYAGYLSGRSGFGIYLSRHGTIPEHPARLNPQDKQDIISQLFRVLSTAQYLVQATEPGDDGIAGYQLSAAAMKWRAADGTNAFHDPIRVPNPPEDGGRTNKFFVDFYKNVAGHYRGIEAREHTAQVPYEQREKREKEFGSAQLPILYCSPTMELGVDIRQLNVVNMRNVPPTPANYAQRSGRAGRSGQPAFVLTYCTTGSSHDQYFFRRQEQMVAGAVNPPRLDLANEDLIRAHIQAIWLAETEQYLGNSLTEILDVEGQRPTLDLLPSVTSGLTRSGVIEKASFKSSAVLQTLADDLADSNWFTDEWLSQILQATMQEFGRACDRWRSLFRAATAQFEHQNSIIADVARRQQWDEAKKLRREAEAQRDLLTDARNVVQSDFYTYRYLASEGFLPGYNFPRLPLSAYIPGRRRIRGQDEFLSRPRFLAVSEFGPRSIIYHEGSRYIVNRVILPLREGDSPVTTSAKQCTQCGYIHELSHGEAGPNVCENCNSGALMRIDSMFRLQNVSTKRRDRITSDEEERTRQGYELRSGVRFKEIAGLQQYQRAEVILNNSVFANLQYGDAATIWRINLGWRRRSNREQFGFVLDMEKGYWQNSDQLPDGEDPADPLGATTQRVVPFVEDRRNCMIFEPADRPDQQTMASLAPALKKAIQAIYQLEDNELSVEPLPTNDDRRQILFYESAEGGAGVLRRLLEPNAFSNVAKQALEVCHFDPLTGDDQGHAPGATETCEAACYDCLMSYANQREHELLDRFSIDEFLTNLRDSKIKSSPAARTFSFHLEYLKERCGSGLEKSWLDYLSVNGLKLPSSSQKFYEQCGTRPDFVYEKEHTVIYIDGPPHDFPERQARDQQQTDCMEDLGLKVVRFHHQDSWREIIQRLPNVFGTHQET